MSKNVVYRTSKGTIITNSERLVLCDAVYGAKFDEEPHPYLLTMEESLQGLDPRKNNKLDRKLLALTRHEEGEPKSEGPITGRIEIPHIRIYSQSSVSENQSYVAVMTLQNAQHEYVVRLSEIDISCFKGVLKDMDQFADAIKEANLMPGKNRPYLVPHIVGILLNSSHLSNFAGFANHPRLAKIGVPPTIDDFI